MATEHQYFYEDEVFRIDKRGNVEFGMVLENSELVSSDDNSDAEDNVKIKKGHIRVAWHPTGAEEVVCEKKVGLADRSLMPGDVVRRMIKGKDTQRGYCRHMEVTACVQVVGTKHIINNIKSSNLVSLEELAPDIAICLDSWVGGIKVVHTKLHLRLTDNSECIVTDPESVGFDIFDEKKDPDSEFPHRGDYYPGQILWGPVNVLNEIADWVYCAKETKALCNSKPNKIVKVMVEDVEIESVAVHWQCRAYSKEGAGSEKEQPKILIQGKDLKRLKLLNVFEPSTLQVGDRNIYTLRPEDEVITKEEWRKRQRNLILNDNNLPVHIKRKKQALQARKQRNEEIRNAGRAAENNGHVDASLKPKESTEQIDGEWLTDTGTESDTGSYASSSASAVSTGTVKRNPSLTVKPWTKVLHKKKLRRAPPKKPPPLPLTPGRRVVVEAVSTMSSADVVWQDGSVETGIPSTELYPIHHLDDQEFFPGDFVIENREDACMRVYGVVQSVDHAGRTASVKWFRTYTSTDNPQPTFLSQFEVSVYDLKDHPDFQYRPGTVVIRVANFQGEDEACTAGQVLDNYPEGRVRVWWVEGHISMCWPQDLYKVGEYDTDDDEEEDEDDMLGMDGGGGLMWGAGGVFQSQNQQGAAGQNTNDTDDDAASWQTESEDCCPNDVSATMDECHNESLKPKLAANIEKARVAMSRLEEIFTQNPSLQTTEVMRKLLEVYKDCRYLDKLMSTSFFHESHFQGLLERVRERGRTNTAQRVADQVNRLFSDGKTDNVPPTTKLSVKGEEDSILSDDKSEDKQQSEVVSMNEEVTAEAEVISGGTQPQPPGSCSSCDQNQQGTVPPHVCNSHVCIKLCSLILTQLVKAHTEVIRRFGGNVGSAMSLSEAADNASPASNSDQTVRPEPDSPTGVPNHVGSQESDSLLQAVNSTELQNGVADDAEGSVSSSRHMEGFSIMETAPNSHKFKLTMFQPTDPRNFYRTVRNEIKLLRSSLPTGIWVKGFEDRMDLYSVMIRGPEKTPYEDGLFFFDFQLPPDYPKSPPNCHYVSYCSDRLNPNLYEDGKVCVSLLGTWSGKGTEIWTSTSNLLQVLVSIQGLILVSEPYFNEAGYEKQKGSQQGRENSRMYNEMVVLKLVQAMAKLVAYPQAIFKDEITAHFGQHANKLCERLESWLDVSENYNTTHPLSPTTPTSFKQIHSEAVALPEFPLIPASKGFCITLRKTLVHFRNVLGQHVNQRCS